MRHSANLDILRAFAVTSVLVQHLVSTVIAHAGLHNLAVIEFSSNIGRAGVVAFFVHTSLVLMYSLERMARSADNVTRRFYLRRFFRIYPLSIFCITLALVLHIPNNTWENADIITPRIVLSNLLLVQNLITKISVIGPLWSLPYEVQMYLVLPALYYLALKRRCVLYLCGLLAFFCGLGSRGNLEATLTWPLMFHAFSGGSSAIRSGIVSRRLYLPRFGRPSFFPSSVGTASPTFTATRSFGSAGSSAWSSD